MKNIDVAVIGGGPAGLAAAVSAKKHGAKSVLILERDACLGGILNQCIHNGFGLHRFGEELTGPEYASRYIGMAKEENVPYLVNTTVLNLTSSRRITAVNPDEGIIDINAGAVVIAAGCRERPAGAISIYGDRCTGIYTAGCAQKFVNIDGYMPGKKVVILGSGDIGLIMARRMTLEGAEVKAVIELMPFSGGLTRNIVQCLDDYGIPLYLSHTVTSVKGRTRLESVTVAEVDERRRPIKSTEREIECDTLLLSVGLLPENELSRGAGIELSPVTGGAVVNERFETSVSGIFACGNVLHVHDLVDYVSEESEAAGRFAAEFAGGRKYAPSATKIVPGKGVRYTVPSLVNMQNTDGDLTIRFRVGEKLTDKKIVVSTGGKVIFSKKRPVLAPGEMETAVCRRDALLDALAPADGADITVEVSD